MEQSRDGPPSRSNITGFRMGFRNMFYRMKRALMCCVTPEPTDGYSTFVINGLASLPAARRSSSYSSKLSSSRPSRATSISPVEDEEFEPLVLSAYPEAVPHQGDQSAMPSLSKGTADPWGRAGYTGKASSSGPGGRSGSGLIVLPGKGSPFMRPGAGRKGDVHTWTSSPSIQERRGLHHSKTESAIAFAHHGQGPKALD